MGDDILADDDFAMMIDIMARINYLKLAAYIEAIAK